MVPFNEATARDATNHTDGLSSPEQWQKYAVSACLGILSDPKTCEAIAANATPDTTHYDPPLTITHGGTYSGNWKSDNPALNAVTISTVEPVIITHSKIAGRGNLIYGRNVNLIVSDTIGYGIGDKPGKFADLSADKSITIDHCVITNVWGVRINGQNSVPTVRIHDNFGYNMSDGGERTAHFIQFADGTYANTSIDNNIAINAPYQSHVEDVINIYNARGTATSPIKISSNKIIGAYSLAPEREGFSGGGIIVDGSGDVTPENAPAYVEITDNIIMDTSNYGLAIAYGNNNRIFNNVILSSGMIYEKIPVKAQNVGLYMWNMSKQSPVVFFNNTAYDNKILWMKATDTQPQATNNWWLPDCDSSHAENCANVPLSRNPEIGAALKMEKLYLLSMFGAGI